MTHEELKQRVWDIPRAEEYMKPFGVIKGVNFVPSYCFSYIEMWHHFDEPVIQRELLYAKNIGINSLRIFVAQCQWETRKDLVTTHLDRFLDICSRMGFSIMLTLQPNTYMIPGYVLDENEDPFQISYRPGVHDGSWNYKGARIFDCKGLWEENKEQIGLFVHQIVAKYGQDSRVSFWDLYNEPWEECRSLLEFAFSCAREENPMQPLSSCWRAWDISDITTFHCYEKPGAGYRNQLNGVHYLSFEEELERAKSTGRPILCTECVARTFGNELKDFLPYYSRNKIGFYVWGLCAGSAQYHIPWDWPLGSPVPKRWFQCLLYPDGTSFDDNEVKLIKEFQFEGPLQGCRLVSG